MKIDIAALKAKFETGDIPTGQDFIDLIDTLQDSISENVIITEAATLNIGKMHVCSGTSVDYLVTLPPVSGNAGKQLSVRMSPSLTKLVTVKGNESELIDGSNTRIMWAGEAATLYCDGTTWTKIGGKTIPMTCQLTLTADTSALTINVATKVKLTGNYNQYCPAAVVDVINGNMITVRPSVYHLSYDMTAGRGNTSVCDIYTRIQLGGVPSRDLYSAHIASMWTRISGTYTVYLPAGNLIEMYAGYNGGSGLKVNWEGNGTMLGMVEIPQW